MMLLAHHHHPDLLAELGGHLEQGSVARDDDVGHAKHVDAALLLLLGALAARLPQLRVLQVLEALKQVTWGGGRDETGR